MADCNGPQESIGMPVRTQFEYKQDVSCIDDIIEPDASSTIGILPDDRGGAGGLIKSSGYRWIRHNLKSLLIAAIVVVLLAWNGCIQTTLNQISKVNCYVLRQEDCKSRMLSSCHKDGIFTIYPTLSKPLSVYCDQTTDGGGWTVIQRRVNGKVNFYRNWSDYKTGFGDLNGNMWVGNEAIHILTETPSELRIDLEDHDGKRAYAKYSMFRVGDEKSGYKLHVSGYTGTTDESSLSGFISVHDGMSFTTYDKDNDKWKKGNCAVLRKGGWWYNGCAKAHLNGIYSKSKVYGGGTGNYWYDWKKLTALKFSEMKVRRIGGRN